MLPPDFSEMVNRSDYVVRARVVATMAEAQGEGLQPKISTKVSLEVLEVIAGEPPAQPVLQFLGGRVGNKELVVDGSPRFQVGGEGVFFVKGNGTTLCPLYAMSYGIYPVAEEAGTKRRYVTRHNQMPLQAVTEVSEPMMEWDAQQDYVAAKYRPRGLSPEEFSSQIKAALRPDSYRARTP